MSLVHPTTKPAGFRFSMRAIVRFTKRGTIKIMGANKQTRFVLDTIMRPAYRSTRYGMLSQIELWGETFWVQWEALPTDKKLAWLLFLNHTIAILTLIEVFLLRRGK